MTQSMGQRYSGFLLLLGGGGGCGEGADCLADAGPGFKFFPFCLLITIKIKIFNSMKNKHTLSFCRKSLVCN